jgi:hypothetical protein
VSEKCEGGLRDQSRMSWTGCQSYKRSVSRPRSDIVDFSAGRSWARYNYFFVIGHDWRKLLRLNVMRNPNALWIMQQAREA